MKVTVMMPAYNEERDLPGLLERTKAALEGWADYQVLIVDDGSKDRTAADRARGGEPDAGHPDPAPAEPRTRCSDAHRTEGGVRL